MDKYGVLGREYPNGFIGLINNPSERYQSDKEEQGDVFEIIQNTILKKEAQSTDGVLPYSPIEILKTAYYADPKVMSDPGFERMLMTIAKDLFFNPAEFVLKQKDSKYFTVMHLRFLKEVFTYVKTGKFPINYDIWASALMESKRGVHEFSISNYSVTEFNDLLKEVRTVYAGKNQSVRFIQDFVSHRGGKEQLLIVLSLILGKGQEI